MATFIIQGKVYNTDKMTFIAYVKKWYKFTGWFLEQMYGKDMGLEHTCSLYRSDKGNWLLTHEYSGKIIGEAITEKEAKELLMRYDYEAYAKEYGELEEA